MIPNLFYSSKFPRWMMSQYGIVFDRDGKQAGPEITATVMREAMKAGWKKIQGNKDSGLIWVNN